MKVGIICAGDREFEPFIEHIQNKKVSKKALLHFHEGTINDVEIVALYSGVCKVNAAIATQILIIPFISIRTITDTADHSGTGHFEENCAKASSISKDITLALLKELRVMNNYI